VRKAFQVIYVVIQFIPVYVIHFAAGGPVEERIGYQDVYFSILSHAVLT
jgi:hypothetical protein